MAPALHSHEEVAERHHSDHPDSDRVVVVLGSLPSEGRDAVVVRRSGHHVVAHRSNRAVVECDGGSHHGEGCSNVVGHGGRSSRLLVGHHSHGLLLDSLLGNESGSAHVDVECRIAAKGCQCRSSSTWIRATLTSEMQRTVESLKVWLSSFSTAVARSAAVSYSTKLQRVSHYLALLKHNSG